MSASHMTEEEYDAFRKQTGHREGQTVKTYYDENKKEAEGLKHHAERRELNRKFRYQQSNLFGKTKYIVQSLKEGTYLQEIEWALAGRN